MTWVCPQCKNDNLSVHYPYCRHCDYRGKQT